jgi:hypothetical protein
VKEFKTPLQPVIAPSATGRHLYSYSSYVPLVSVLVLKPMRIQLDEVPQEPWNHLICTLDSKKVFFIVLSVSFGFLKKPE